MQRIKIFKALEYDFEVLENEVNTWIATHKVKVLNIFGNIAPQSESPLKGQFVGNQGGTTPSDILLIIHYETA